MISDFMVISSLIKFNVNLLDMRLYFKKLICSVELKEHFKFSCFLIKCLLIQKHENVAFFHCFQTVALNKHVNEMTLPPYLGRFDGSVIEERRQCSEDLLQFSANIPALHNSQHLQEFFKVCKQELTGTHMCVVSETVFTLFKGGEIHDGSELIGPAEPHSDFLADSISDSSSDGEYNTF